MFVLAYNQGKFCDVWSFPEKSSTSPFAPYMAKLVKIGGKVVHHSRIVTFQMAKVAVNEEI